VIEDVEGCFGMCDGRVSLRALKSDDLLGSRRRKMFSMFSMFAMFATTRAEARAVLELWRQHDDDQHDGGRTDRLTSTQLKQ
jgi:hypothetical protein